MSGLKSLNTTVLTKKIGVIGSISKVLGDRFAANCLFRADSTINAKTQKGWVFKTGHNPNKTRDDNYKLVDVCLASAAAPIFFPIHKQKNPDDENENQYFVDGGLWANNPVLSGLVEALTITSNDGRPIQIVSVGTCEKPTGDPYTNERVDKGILDWKRALKSSKCQFLLKHSVILG